MFEDEGRQYSLDNRRLFAMKVAMVQRVVAEKVQVRRDLLNERLTTSCSGQVVVFADDPSISFIVDLQVALDSCSARLPNCLHQVEVTEPGCEQAQRKIMTAQEIVKIQAKNRLPISDHFIGAFEEVMRSLAFPVPEATKGRKKRR